MNIYFLVIFKELVKFKPDLVYFTLSPTGYAFYRDFLFVILIKLFSVKIVYHLHGKGIKSKSKFFINKLIYSFVFNESKVIILSKLLEDDLDGIIKDKKSQIFYLPNGISEDLNDKINRDNVDSPPVVLYLSNLARTKGIIDLVKSAEILVYRNIDFKLLIVGNKHATLPEEEFLSLISNPIVSKNIEYLGPKYGKDKSLVFQHSDIFVFPTYMPHEAFPLVLLEAMKFSLPVISTYEGAIPEIIDHGVNGFIVQKNNPQAIADRIAELIANHELRHDFGVNSRIKYELNYSSLIFEKRLNNILKSIITKLKRKF